MPRAALIDLALALMRAVAAIEANAPGRLVFLSWRARPNAAASWRLYNLWCLGFFVGTKGSGGHRGFSAAIGFGRHPVLQCRGLGDAQSTDQGMAVVHEHVPL